MYTAKINSKSFKGGKLIVEVTYTDGNENITDTMESTHKQDKYWIQDTIIRKLNDLNSLAAINESIVIGAFNEEMRVKSEKEIYYEKASLYLKYINMARNGFVASDRPIIVELHAWLKNNFTDEYINIF